MDFASIDITTVLAVTCSGVVFLAWFVLPSTKEKKSAELPVSTPETSAPSNIATEVAA